MQRIKRWLATWICLHRWDQGHPWYDNAENRPEGDAGLYYLCTKCEGRWNFEYPC